MNDVGELDGITQPFCLDYVAVAGEILDELADEFFGFAVAVGLGRVDEVDARGVEGLESGLDTGPFDGVVPVPGCCVAPGPGAYAEVEACTGAPLATGKEIREVGVGWKDGGWRLAPSR